MFGKYTQKTIKGGNQMPSITLDRAELKIIAQNKSDKVCPANIGDVLDIKSTPDKPRKTWHRTHGVKTGLGIMAFWALLFDANEIRLKSEKMTNAEIERLVREEFPHEETLLSNLDSGRQSVNYYRHLFNKGRMSQPKGSLPTNLSFRYDIGGNLVDTRSGKRVLKADEIVALENKYRG
jgi:hypothetical protein